MDFRLDEDLVSAQELAQAIFGEHTSPERLRAAEAADATVDRGLWGLLGESGLLGLALPEEVDGAGLGLPGLAVVLEEQGRSVAPVPIWSAVVGARAVATHAPGWSHLAELAAGRSRVALAVEEYAGATACQARPASDTWLLNGAKALVPSPQDVDGVVVVAATDDGPGLFLVDADQDGLFWSSVQVTSRDRAADLVLVECRGVRLGDAGAAALVLAEAAVAVAAVQLGVVCGALDHAVRYLAERRQFDRPLGSLQAVQHQLADCWIDAEAMRVTLWQAVSDLAEGGGAEPLTAQARRSVPVAAWWAGQAGLDVVHRVQHLHGGIGVDVDYPVHRHFLWGKQLSGTLGGPAAVLESLGEVLASGPAADAGVA